MLTMHNPQRIVWHATPLELQRTHCDSHKYCYGIRLISGHWPSNDDLVRLVKFILNSQTVIIFTNIIIEDLGSNEKVLMAS